MPTYLHMNGCSYELQETKDGDLQPLLKQVNNVILVNSIKIERVAAVTFDELIARIRKNTESDEPVAENLFWLHPMCSERMQEKMDFTVVCGVMAAVCKQDPSQPILVEGGPAEQHAALIDALTPKNYEKSFILALPETPEYMWDLSFSHVPPTAITYVGEEKTAPEGGDSPPMTLDPMQSFTSAEDSVKLANFKIAIEKQMNQSPQTENFQFDEATLARDAGFSCIDDMRAFLMRNPNTPFHQNLLKTM